MAEINNWFQYELEINNFIFVDHTTSVDDWLNSYPIFFPPRYARLYRTSNLSDVLLNYTFRLTSFVVCEINNYVDGETRWNKYFIWHMAWKNNEKSYWNWKKYLCFSKYSCPPPVNLMVAPLSQWGWPNVWLILLLLHRLLRWPNINAALDRQLFIFI